MTKLGAVITEAIVIHYGRDELLRRLAHPFWFQSFGSVMGMDWHSSGITTSVIGALKRGLTPLSGELGIHVCGGRGQNSWFNIIQFVGVVITENSDGLNVQPATYSDGNLTLSNVQLATKPTSGQLPTIFAAPKLTY